MGTTIGSIVISYDIDSMHTEVKDALKEMGYSTSFRYKDKKEIYELPNTTLWHTKKSSTQAMADLESVCLNFNATLEKAICVKATEFVGYLP